MITFTTATTPHHLEGILALQSANLAAYLDQDEVQSQGFVTVVHSYEQLRRMNEVEKHIIALDGDTVVGYLLAMTKAAKADIPVLVPMFETFDETDFKNQKIADCNYLVVGQVCIAKNYRGRGMLDECYAAYRAHYQSKYDFAITEIATSNTRSLNAHKRIGFRHIKTYTAPDQTQWNIVLWDWQ